MAIQEYKSEINELQKIQLSMLKDFDAVCQKHRISYQLFSGTALGAVKHKGFIPWDDDIDVVMLREDYERFFDSASKKLDSNKYYVQREFSEHWPMFFFKTSSQRHNIYRKISFARCKNSSGNLH